MTRPIRIALFAASLAGAAALGALGMTLVRGRPTVVAGHPEEHDHEDHGEHAQGVVEMSTAKQKSAGIAVEPARLGDLTLTTWVTGKVAPNEDRLAHVYSLVEGTVHEVKVRYGDRVKAGDDLVMIDSKEVGQAKLALVQSQLDARIAEVNLGWKQTIAENTQALITALEEGIAPHQIAERFREKPMGKYREELVSAYARLFQARAEFERAGSLVERKSISQREYEKARADYEAAQATYSSLKERARFTTEQERIQAQQALEQAQVAESTSCSALYILGYSERQVATMDPLGEGEEVAHYAITAPFDGTILAKDVVVEERVGPQTKLFDLADLSTVWVQADIYQKDLAGLSELNRKAIRFRSSAYPGRTFEAKVFYTGEVVDPINADRPDDGGGRQPGTSAQAGAVRRDRDPYGDGREGRPGAGIGDPDRCGGDLRLRPAIARRIRAPGCDRGARGGRCRRGRPGPGRRRDDRCAGRIRPEGRAEARRTGRGGTSPLATLTKRGLAPSLRGACPHFVSVC